MPSTRNPLRAGDGDFVQVAALGVRFLIGGQETDGRFAVVEHPLPGRALGSPIHTHHNEEECSFVLEGRFGIQLGDEVFEAGPGDLVLKPRGIPHAFWNAGDEPARLLELISPAGFEKYFRELARLRADPQRNAAAITELRACYQLDMDLASASVLAQRHGLRPG